MGKEKKGKFKSLYRGSFPERITSYVGLEWGLKKGKRQKNREFILEERGEKHRRLSFWAGSTNQ